MIIFLVVDETLFAKLNLLKNINKTLFGVEPAMSSTQSGPAPSNFPQRFTLSLGCILRSSHCLELLFSSALSSTAWGFRPNSENDIFISSKGTFRPERERIVN